MRIKIAIFLFGMILLSGLSRSANASRCSMVSFTYGYIDGQLTFDEEATPASSITYTLTIAANLDVTIYNCTLRVLGLISDTWQTLHVEQILSYSMTQGGNLTRPIMITVPQNTSERLYCIIEASTDKGFGRTAFDATYIRPVSYAQLSESYSKLQANHSALQADYAQASAEYGALNSTYNQLATEYEHVQAGFSSLNFTYESLIANYSSLASDYGSLREDYAYIKTKYDASINELSIVRNLMYIFSLTTVIFVATTVYLRKKAPYILLRKETAVKPDKEQ